MSTDLQEHPRAEAAPDPFVEGVRRLFRRARKQPQERREAWLEANVADPEAAAAVRALLAHDVEAHEDRDELLGREIGGWKLEEPLGRGGSGRVYRSRRGDRLGALKLLDLRHSGHDGNVGERLAIERAALERLSHPAIVRMLDAGTADLDGVARDYLVTELIEDAEPLLDGAARDNLSLESRIALLAEIADAVGHAHAMGVVHRDLKPENVVLDGEGRPRILDFGIALRSAGHGFPDPDGATIGSLSCLAPEQVKPSLAPVTTRTDVYALGVLGFRLLTGTAPYELGGSTASAVQAVLHVPAPDPRELEPAIPIPVADVLSRAMRKSPSARPDDGVAFGAVLRARPAARPLGIGPRHGRSLAAATLLLAVCIAGYPRLVPDSTSSVPGALTHPKGTDMKPKIPSLTLAASAAMAASALVCADLPTLTPIKTIVVPGPTIADGIAVCGQDIVCVRGSDRSIRVHRPASDGSWVEFSLPDQTSPGDTQYTEVFGEGNRLAVVLSNQAAGGDRVEMYERDLAGAWRRSQTINAPSSGAFHYLMHADMDGDFLLVVDRYADAYRGAGYVYRRNANGTWIQEAKIQGASATPYFTEAVLGQIDDGKATLCAWLNPCGYSAASGRIYVFRRNADSTWSQEADIRPAWSTCGDSFGNLAGLFHGQVLNLLHPSTVFHRFQFQDGQWQQAPDFALPSDNQNGIRTRRTSWGFFSLRGTGSVWAVSWDGSSFLPLGRLDPPVPYFNNSDGQFALGADGNRCAAFTGLDATTSLISIYDATPLLDCDGDGIPNADEIAAGAPDCDANGIPDSCEGSGEHVSPTKAPFGFGQPLSHTFNDLPNAGDTVNLVVEAKADLGGLSEFVTVKADGATLTTLFAVDGQDCPANDQERTIAIPAAQFNEYLADGSVTIELVASSLVSAKECPSSSARVRLTYVGQFSDCDGNGESDACQIAADPGLDKNGDGTLDSCNYAKGDFDLNNAVDAGDIAYLLALWGSVNPPVGDMNGDGVIGAQDLGSVLANWGPINP